MPKINPEDVYLGDGLYAGFDGWQLVLYAHNGIRATDSVYLEPAVLAAFIRYCKEMKLLGEAT